METFLTPEQLQHDSDLEFDCSYSWVVDRVDTHYQVFESISSDPDSESEYADSESDSESDTGYQDQISSPSHLSSSHINSPSSRPPSKRGNSTEVRNPASTIEMIEFFKVGLLLPLLIFLPRIHLSLFSKDENQRKATRDDCL